MSNGGFTKNWNSKGNWKWSVSDSASRSKQWTGWIAKHNELVAGKGKGGVTNKGEEKGAIQARLDRHSAPVAGWWKPMFKNVAGWKKIRYSTILGVLNSFCLEEFTWYCNFGLLQQTGWERRLGDARKEGFRIG
jgi:hypothetical protein